MPKFKIGDTVKHIGGSHNFRIDNIYENKYVMMWADDFGTLAPEDTKTILYFRDAGNWHKIILHGKEIDMAKEYATLNEVMDGYCPRCDKPSKTGLCVKCQAELFKKPCSEPCQLPPRILEV